jgi:hypothetical protein
MSMPQVMSRVGAAVMRASVRTATQRTTAATSTHHGHGFAARSAIRTHAASSAAAAPAVADAPKAIYLSEYAAPDYLFAKVALDFTLGEETTVVGNAMSVEPTYEVGLALFTHVMVHHTVSQHTN